MKKTQPTPAELRILNVLWEHGPLSHRAIYEILTAVDETGYTTVLKHLQIMLEKGLVKRDERKRPHIFRAARKREATQRDLLRNLLDKAFDGSTKKLVLGALSARRVSAKELREIRDVIDRLGEE